MKYEDAVTIPTPEGIELEYPLAGLASRFLALFADIVLRILVIAAVFGILSAIGRGPVTAVILVVVVFLALFAYDIAFEVWGGGRTPGKRWTGLRVTMATGKPIGFASSAVRNLLRIVDEWGTVFIAGMVTILLTHRNQRLGDLAAGTIVVRERRVQIKRSSIPESPAPEGLDVSAVNASETAAVRDFLSRREALAAAARDRVAQLLADGLRPKVGGLPPGAHDPEDLLEMIAAAKSAPSRDTAP